MAENDDKLNAEIANPTLHFDCRAGCATSRAAAIAMLVGRRVSATRNAPISLLSRCLKDPPRNVGHDTQRELLKQHGRPWCDEPAALRYGSLLLMHDNARAVHVRLRLPRTAESAHALERVVFDEKRWPASGVISEEHPLYGATPLHPAVM